MRLSFSTLQNIGVSGGRTEDQWIYPPIPASLHVSLFTVIGQGTDCKRVFNAPCFMSWGHLVVHLQ